MKTKTNILKTCSLGIIFLKNQNKIHFRRSFENKINYDHSKVHNYHLAKVFKN
jgi:hypothetical protein